MNKDNQDIVDKAFNIAHWGFANASKLADELKDSVISSAKYVEKAVVGDEEIISSVEAHSTFGKMNIPFPGFLSAGRDNWVKTAGFSATAILMCWGCHHMLRVPSKLPVNENKCVLILGNRNDPIVRSQIADLFRRKYTVFLCSENIGDENEDEEFLFYLDPSSNKDLMRFIDYLTTSSSIKMNLAAILFMPNIAYHVPGSLTTEVLNSTFNANISVYYDVLMKILPHLPYKKTPLFLYNPSLAYNMQISTQPATTFVSGCINSLYQVLRHLRDLQTIQLNLGVFQLGGQPSNYKYLEVSGPNINKALFDPVYKLIISFNGNFLQRAYMHLITLNGLCSSFHFGKYSLLSSLIPGPYLVKVHMVCESRLKSFAKYLSDLLYKSSAYFIK
ncbi:hypothetical protein NCAS_0A09000 [Naumovozyma castellii]|uniref:DUF1776 family protein n=1 Tax=Naumovozyma castellii TaxID=27288 RepID=G0V7L0_NAUCA|nr:hypothetical protein NCAS_0A09000 [Naumovozyma castellii CBS 4309]CCC67458.1 hypothetical protein NCAS_0A09000 [Naumovozyma castellii CBS 4309]